MKMKWGIIAGVLGGIAAAEAGGSANFNRQTLGKVSLIFAIQSHAVVFQSTPYDLYGTPDFREI